MKRDRLHDRVDLVIAIRPRPKDVQGQVELGECGQNQGHVLTSLHAGSVAPDNRKRHTKFLTPEGQLD